MRETRETTPIGKTFSHPLCIGYYRYYMLKESGNGTCISETRSKRKNAEHAVLLYEGRL